MSGTFFDLTIGSKDYRFASAPEMRAALMRELRRWSLLKSLETCERRSALADRVMNDAEWFRRHRGQTVPSVARDALDAWLSGRWTEVTDDDIRAAELGDPDVCEDCPELIAWAAAQPNVHLVTGENDAYQDGGGGHVPHGFWSGDPRTAKVANEIVLCSPMAHDWIINALAAHVGRAPLDVLTEIAATDEETER